LGLRVLGSGFGVEGLGCRVESEGRESGCRSPCSPLPIAVGRVESLGIRVWGMGVSGLGFGFKS